jgi:hypothetical protein
MVNAIQWNFDNRTNSVIEFSIVFGYRIWVEFWPDIKYILYNRTNSVLKFDNRPIYRDFPDIEVRISRFDCIFFSIPSYPCDEFSSSFSDEGWDITEPDLLTGPEVWWGDTPPWLTPWDAELRPPSTWSCSRSWRRRFLLQSSWQSWYVGNSGGPILKRKVKSGVET